MLATTECEIFNGTCKIAQKCDMNNANTHENCQHFASFPLQTFK